MEATTLFGNMYIYNTWYIFAHNTQKQKQPPPQLSEPRRTPSRSTEDNIPSEHGPCGQYTQYVIPREHTSTVFPKYPEYAAVNSAHPAVSAQTSIVCCTFHIPTNPASTHRLSYSPRHHDNERTIMFDAQVGQKTTKKNIYSISRC